MKTILKKGLATLLTVALLLSCLSVISLSVSAEATAPTLDGTKDALYADAYVLEISTAYAGSGQALTSNVNNIKTISYYTWDANYVYIWTDVYDPNNACANDLLYFASGNYASGDMTFTFNAPNGGGWEYDFRNKVVGGIPGPIEFKEGSGTDATRSYEFRFPLAEGAVGFVFNPVAHVSGSHIISYGTNMYVTSFCKQVTFDDPSTFVDTSAIDPNFGKEPEPTPDPEPSNAPDGVKDDRYVDTQMLEISQAYAGSGGGKIANVNHVFTRSYYAWDDDYVYIWVDVFDPDNVGSIDVFYFANGVFDSTDRSFIFQKDGGGDLEIKLPENSTKESNPQSTLQWAITTGAGDRAYEFQFDRMKGAPGFTFGPVVWMNGGYSVSYGSNYYVTGDCKSIVFNDPASFYDTSAIDANVVNDPAKLQTIEDAMATLPEDASSLTIEDQALVDGVKETVSQVPASWLSRANAALVTRYNAAVEKMTALKAEQQQEAIKQVEDLIDALPDSVGLDRADDVAAAKEAYDALGDIKSFVNQEKIEKLNAAVIRINTLSAPVKIDGKRDPAYEAVDTYDISQEYTIHNSSDMWGITPDTTGVVTVLTDEDYMYMYVEVFDANRVLVPDGVDFITAMENRYDGIITYINMDPANDPVGAPYQDDLAAGCMDYYFDMLADGTLHDFYIVEGKNEYLQDPTYFVPFATETTYGYEMRVPRVEGEEDFSFNIVIADPAYDEAGDGSLVFNADNSRFIAFGGEWWANYVQWGRFYYEDFPTFYNYVEIEEMINSLPDPEALKNKDCEKAAQKAKAAMAYLNEDQLQAMNADLVQKLDAVLLALENLVEGVYGDVDGDTEVTAADALEVLKSVVGKIQVTEEQTVLADVNGNQNVGADDALLILQKVVGKIQIFPVEQAGDVA
ncbi:MAG: hypothetical protein IJP35_05885 [Clostridia bacterium]|nr:hypothetical protein [Clostridia bacterium]